MANSTHPIAAALMAAVFTTVAQAQPAVSGVTNAASYAHPTLPNGSIAQGSMFVIFGTNMGPAAIVQSTSLPLPTSLGGTSVKVTVGATTVDAPMIYSLASQVAAILPSGTPAGAGRLTVTYNGATSAAANITVVPASFGIFTRNQAGSGPAIVQNFVSDAERPVNAVYDAAHPGQVVTIWGTGLGPIAQSDAGPPPIGDLATDVEVLIGSKRIRPLYKGRAYMLPGMDQINVVIPQDVELGCYVPLAVRAGGITSNYGSIAVAASGKACSEPATGYTAAEVERALAKGNVAMGGISLSRSRIRLDIQLPIPGAPTEMKTDSGSGSFTRFDATTLAASRSAFGAASPFGSCVVYTFSGQSPNVTDPIRAVGLDAGAALNVSGPRGAKQLTRQAPGVYSATLGGGGISIPGMPGGTGQPEYLEPGSYTVTGSGGADVGAFSASLQVPAPLVWSNAASISTVNRSRDLTVTWTGGGRDQYVAIVGGSVGPQAGATFICTELASKGTFTVNSAVLSALPPSIVSEGVPTGSLALTTGTSGNAGKFQATGLDFGYITYSDMDMKNVNYQ